MRYRCKACGASQWRGFFPEQVFHIRYAVFHGVAIGIASVCGKAYFERIDHIPEGWIGGLTTLAVGVAILLPVYAIAIAVEVSIVAFFTCAACGSRCLRWHPN